ncbi:hypothetical protein [Bdellovibrio svalbardensis]|uniref:Uncharacterized protein n=1 Tax=Bdellovibrio svalbardensis TaxID=2972972 RepID=A0ABT6DKL5_9BACT|nr:hypothetical protein [Bdellovibrio svalbardensis]MDG0816454.1 hypothetical protein [Bdellovibrio svalbardensis]
MKLPITISFLMASLLTISVKAAENLPTLNTIKTVALSGSRDEDQTKNFRLYLSSYAYKGNDPELVLTTNKTDFVVMQSGYQGPNLSFLADIGDTNLENITLKNAIVPDLITGRTHNFSKAVLLQVNHTYSVILNTTVARGVLVFRVDAIRNGEVIISYAVKQYDVMTKVESSEGQDEQKGNEREVYAERALVRPKVDYTNELKIHPKARTKRITSLR